jgi:uncharacterized membrane protein
MRSENARPVRRVLPPVPVLVLLSSLCWIAAAKGAPRKNTELKAEQWFAVHGVEEDDVLNVRRGPTPRSATTGAIPPDARDVRATGRTARLGPSTWREVVRGKTRGWVNDRYLVVLEAAPAAAPAPDDTSTSRPPSAQPRIASETGFVCYFNQPLWTVKVREDGGAACLETCKGPAGLRATTAPLGKARPDSWAVQINRPNGTRFMALSIKRTGSCVENVSKEVYPYEALARRHGEGAYSGCCRISQTVRR